MPAGLRERDLDHRRTVSSDAGLGVHPFAHAQRGLRQIVQATTSPALLHAGFEGLPELSEDLLVAQHHGVQPAGHPEGVAHRGILVVHVEVLGQHISRHS